MRLKLFVLLLLSASLPILARTVKLQGVVVDAATGAPIPGATISLRTQGIASPSGVAGDFLLPGVNAGQDYLLIVADGYSPMGIDINTPNVADYTIGEIKLSKEGADAVEFYSQASDMVFDESVIEDEEGNTQNVSALTGANDNLYYSTASYNFGPMYFRYRGYDSQYQDVYINGIRFNDLIRGRFNFSSLLGMTSRAFRNKTTTVGLDASAYGFGDIGGSVNYNTRAEDYSPGFNGSVAYTNSNYMLRALLQYSSGMNKHGWAYSVAAIGRYSKEGVVDGTFYNSAGLFLSLEKRLNAANSLSLTAFGGPTQRANSSATYQEAYDLVGSNLYNPNWGWYDGKKRASRIVETFDPTVMLNWLYKKDNTTINTGASVRWVNYSTSALQYYKANDPNPTYYRYLPSYYDDNQELFDLYTDLWRTDESFRQVKWDELYRINAITVENNKALPEAERSGASYIQENRHSNQFNAMFNSYLNHRLNSQMAIQAGVSFNYTNGSFYKTVRDLLGADFWLDVDPFSDRDISIAPDNLQNDLDNPNRRVGKGDRFGYDYNLYALQATAWAQHVITTPRWDVNYGMKIAYTQYQREGHMRNGRAPLNSLGKGQIHRFDDATIKAGAVYKLDGRNYFSLHAEYGTRAPLVDNIYIAPRVKDTSITDPTSERIFSGDIGYTWNYRRFRGSITGFYTSMADVTERFGFYDEQYNTYTNYVISGAKRVYKGIELGMAYKITPSITATFAGTYSRYQYKNNPEGTRSFENGLYPDTSRKIYLKNCYAGSVPQSVFNVGIDYAAPQNWFFNLNGTFQGDAYVNLAPAYHESLAHLWQQADENSGLGMTTVEELEARQRELSAQDKLKNAFTLNASIGKAIYFKNNLALNFNVSVNNFLNNKDVVTYAYQQGRLDTKNYDRNAYPNRYTYSQGIRVFVNVGIRF